MTLVQLKDAVDNIFRIAECDGHLLENIIVSIQIDDTDGFSVCSNKELELMYDNNLQVSGCVLVGTCDSVL